MNVARLPEPAIKPDDIWHGIGLEIQGKPVDWSDFLADQTRQYEAWEKSPSNTVNSRRKPRTKAKVLPPYLWVVK